MGLRDIARSAIDRTSQRIEQSQSRPQAPEARLLGDVSTSSAQLPNESTAIRTSSVSAVMKHASSATKRPPPESTSGEPRDFSLRFGVDLIKDDLKSAFLLGKSDGKSFKEIQDKIREFIDGEYSSAQTSGRRLNQTQPESMSAMNDAVTTMLSAESKRYYDLAIENQDSAFGQDALRVHKGFEQTAEAFRGSELSQQITAPVRSSIRRGDSDLHKSPSPLDVLGQRSSKPSGPSGPDF